MGSAYIAMFEAEHDAFVSLARGLTPEQWELPSLCRGWTVRDVVEHTAFHIHATLKEFVPSSEKMTARMLEREHADSIDGLLALLASPTRARAPYKINTCELVVHQEDVRGAVGSSRDYPEPTMRMCLDYCTSVTGNLFVVDRRRRLGRGVRLVATDMSWSRGDGPEVAASGRALLMAVAGRRAALSDLTGPGVAIMAGRFGAVETPAAA